MPRRSTASSAAASSTCAQTPAWVLYLCVALVVLILLILLIQWFRTYSKTEKYEDAAEPSSSSAAAPPPSSSGPATDFRMIYVHMQGCPYCTEFLPVWRRLEAEHGQDLAKESRVHLEDYDREDPQWKAINIELSGYPSVVMVRASDGSMVGQFAAERTVSALKSWAISTSAAAALSASS